MYDTLYCIDKKGLMEYKILYQRNNQLFIQHDTIESVCCDILNSVQSYYLWEGDDFVYYIYGFDKEKLIKEWNMFIDNRINHFSQFKIILEPKNNH